eukprot:TRINITY_DN1779_c0_g1_i2.p1 TRINITY_DN1779_c0_g1~~TRINITY_DN1779_c0_g1_i2.p1  ORF type:complete len:395 (+),score=46.41 TRINITY_DN1779_c0_g1_i2:164-1348(+)
MPRLIRAFAGAGAGTNVLFRPSRPAFANILAHLFPGGAHASNPLITLCAENCLGIAPYCDGKGHTLTITTSQNDFERHLPDAEFLITTPCWPVPLDAERLATARNLSVCVAAGVGASEYIDIESAATMGVTVAEITGANAAAYSNHVTMMAIAALRDAAPNGPVVSAGLAAVRAAADNTGATEGSPRPEEVAFDLARATARSVDISGRSVGVIGCGRVGYRVMMRLAALDCNITYHDKNRLRRELEVHVGTMFVRSVEALVAESDLIVVCVPRTKWTRGLLSQEILTNRIRPGAVIVNAAFHDVIDTDALGGALRSGRVAGYATDCWPNQKPDVKLAEHPNTFLWAPSGGYTLDAQSTIATGVLGLLERFTTQRNYPACSRGYLPARCVSCLRG